MMMAAKLLVQIAVMMMAPAAFRHHRKRGGESPPSSSSSSSLTLSHREKGFPFGPWPPWHGRVRAPPRLDLSLCPSLFLRSLILPFHCFFNSRRSVTPIGLKFLHDFYPDIGFLAAKKGHQPHYGVSKRAQGVPYPLGRAPHPRGPLGHCLALIPLPKIHIHSKKISVSFYPVWTPFDMDFLWNKKHATNRNWHWALDQYVSPKIV